MKRILVSIAICAWAAPASAGPTRLSMRWVNGENIHLAGQRGAINRRTDIKLELELQAGGKLLRDGSLVCLACGRSSA